MAIKVIGQDETLGKKLSCRNCGSILFFYRRDVVVEKVSGETSYFIPCPTCGVKIEQDLR